METTGGSEWSGPPAAHIPPSGAVARTAQDWPGERARRGQHNAVALVFLVETWGVLRRTGEKTMGQKREVEEEKGARLVRIIFLPRSMKHQSLEEEAPCSTCAVSPENSGFTCRMRCCALEDRISFITRRS